MQFNTNPQDLFDTPTTRNFGDLTTAHRNWDMFTISGALYFPNRHTQMSFSTFFVLAKRGNILVTNPLSIQETLIKIYRFFRLQPQCLRWIFTWRANQVNLARWFAWETNSDAYMHVQRDLIIFSVQEHLYSLSSRYLSYSFLYYMGVDVAFIFTSFKDDDHFLDFKDRGIPTIGFDGGHHHSVYTYGLPGGLNSSTVLIYARVLVGLLGEVRKGHKFWTLHNNNFVM